MATIKQKRGRKSAVPTLARGELFVGFNDDETAAELFVGKGNGTLKLNLKGEDGDAGVRGSQWFTGTSLSGTSASTGAYAYSSPYSDTTYKYVGDYYLNTANGNVYRCTTAGSYTAAKWTYQGKLNANIVSPTWVYNDSDGCYENSEIIYIEDLLVGQISLYENDMILNTTKYHGYATLKELADDLNTLMLGANSNGYAGLEEITSELHDVMSMLYWDSDAQDYVISGGTF